MLIISLIFITEYLKFYSMHFAMRKLKKRKIIYWRFIAERNNLSNIVTQRDILFKSFRLFYLCLCLIQKIQIVCNRFPRRVVQFSRHSFSRARYETLCFLFASGKIYLQSVGLLLSYYTKLL